MCNLKQYVSECLQIDQNQLHDISLEDVQLLQDAQRDISTIVDEMITDFYPALPTDDPTLTLNNGVPCKGYWVEGTKDLVIYIALRNLSRTIVIPRNGWMIRADITIN